nr:restriction endonuclease subunit S [uncultured Flavobacterium sp.]
MEYAKLVTLLEKTISGEWGVEGNDVPVLRSTNFTNEGKLDFSNVVNRSVDSKKVSVKKLYKGDIIIEKSGGSPTQPVGRVVYFDADGTFICNNFTSILRPKEKLIYPKFLFYQLFIAHKRGITSNFQNKTTGIINLKLDRYLSELEIPLPDLATQQRIAALLDKADELRQYNKQLIEKYDALTQSLFLDMFGDPVRNEKGWEKMKLGNLSDMSSGSTPSRTKEENFNGSIPWVKTTEVNGKVITDTLEKISEDALKNSSCKLFPEGSIVIAMYGQGKTRGQIGILGIEAATNQACCVLKPSEKANFTYVYYTLSSLYDDLRELGRGGNQPNLNLGILKNYEIIFPHRNLQNQFAERVQLIEQQKELAQQALQKSEELFNSLLQKAFKGELVPEYEL